MIEITVRLFTITILVLVLIIHIRMIIKLNKIEKEVDRMELRIKKITSEDYDNWPEPKWR